MSALFRLCLPPTVVLLCAVVGFSRVRALEPEPTTALPRAFDARSSADDRKDHPLAAKCRAAPHLCVCAVERVTDCVDTKERRPAFQKCLVDVLKANQKSYRGSKAELRHAVEDHCTKKLGGRECGPATCVRWSGLRDGLGTDGPDGLWIRWRVFEEIDPALQPPETEGIPPHMHCVTPALPGQSACRINLRDDAMKRVYFERVAEGRFARATGVAEAEFAKGGAVHYFGTDLVRAGKWLERDLEARDEHFPEYTGDVVLAGNYEVVTSSGGTVSRRSGAWRKWQSGYATELAHYTPAGPGKVELLDGDWASFEQGGGVKEAGSYAIQRDDVSDVVFSARRGLWRHYEYGKLKSANFYEAPTSAGEGAQRRGRVQIARMLEFHDSGQPKNYSERRSDEKSDGWDTDGLEVRWSPRGRLLQLSRSHDGVMWGEGLRLAPLSTDELPWPAGEVMGQVRGVMRSSTDFWGGRGREASSSRVVPDRLHEVAGRFLASMTGEDGASEFDHEAESQLSRWLTVVELPTDPSLFGTDHAVVARFASPRAECHARRPVPNASRVFCTADAACAEGEVCDIGTNACVVRGPETSRGAG
jgi:Cys-rich repeat protein